MRQCECARRCRDITGDNRSDRRGDGGVDEQSGIMLHSLPLQFTRGWPAVSPWSPRVPSRSSAHLLELAVLFERLDDRGHPAERQA